MIKLLIMMDNHIQTSRINGDSKTIPGLISVVMPCYNAEKYIQEAIDSVLNQSYPYIELIVIDDGSNDDSTNIINGYRDRIQFLEQKNKGPYPARNLGLKHAKGEFIAFLDADDWWDLNFLEVMHAALTKHNAVLSYCGWQNKGSKHSDNKPYIPPEYYKNDIHLSFLKSCPWPIHAALVCRHIVDRVGGFSELYYSSMDYDFWLKISAISNEIIRVPKVLAYYRWHNEGQISSVVWRQVLNSWNVRKNFVMKHPELLNHLPKSKIREATTDYLTKKAFSAYWLRDLTSSHKLFRKMLQERCWAYKDLKYLIPALLPESMYKKLILWLDTKKTANSA